MRSELFRCNGDCGVLYPILVDRRGASPLCVACGQHASPLSEREIIDELRTRMRTLLGDEGTPPRLEADASPVNLKARIHAAEQVGELLRFIEGPGNGREVREARNPDFPAPGRW